MSVRHGTDTGYGHYGCRCTACREAHRMAQAAWKTRQGEPWVHNYATYNNYGCRCETCRAAHSAYQRQRYQQPKAAAS